MSPFLKLRKFRSIILTLILSLPFFTGCNEQSDKTESKIPSYNPYIEAFTSGTISRFSPVHIVFSEEIPEKRVDTLNLSKAISFKPKVEGTFTLESDKILFRPKKEFQRGTTYSVTIDLSTWFDVKSDQKIFSFDFKTLPININAKLESFDINPDHDNSYDITCILLTPDIEYPETIKSLIKLSEKADTTWIANPQGGRTNTLKIRNIAAHDNKERDFIISSDRNKFNLPQEELLSIRIPDRKEFAVYDINFISEPEKYVEITFTSSLDKDQDLRGLAMLEIPEQNLSSERVSISGNKLRLYPDTNMEGAVNIFLSESIRSNSGENLKARFTSRIEISKEIPAVRFCGDGVIIPQSSQLTIPFQAIYLRGVVVRVIRIMEKNMGSFLQYNTLSGSSELYRVGRPIARKTIFLDEDGSRSSNKWNTYSIDLTELIEPEPGAVYRIELSFTKDLSAYPCADMEQKSKEQLLAEDKVKFEQETKGYDNGYYYYSEYSSYWGYNYSEREDPCSDSFYYYSSPVAKNILASNIGVIAKAGTDGKLSVMTRNLNTTLSEAGVNIAIYNFQNGEIASGITDAKGECIIDTGAGKPFYLIASKDRNKTYLRLDDGSSLSLSTFDISGGVVQKGIKGYIYGERGVWRPGDTIHLGFMINDKSGKIPDSHPVVMELYNPSGQLYAKSVSSSGIFGLHSFNIATEEDAPTGIWSAVATVGGVSFSSRIRVESVKPNRLKIEIDFKDDLLVRKEEFSANLHAEWLHGATAPGLKYEINASFSSTPTQFKGYESYTFTDKIKTFYNDETPFASGTTDQSGNAVIKNRLDIGSNAPGMLRADLTTRVFEESGDFSIDGFSLNYSPYREYVGLLSPQGRDGGALETGKEHTFKVITLDYTGAVAPSRDLKVTIYKVRWYWWWDSNNSNLANYISNIYNEPVKIFEIKSDQTGAASFNLSFTDNEWGTYYIIAEDKVGKHSSGIMAYFDWPYYYGNRELESGESAVTLKIKSDKESYNVGEMINITAPSSKGSKAILTIETGTKVLKTMEFDSTENESTFSIRATEDMLPGIYAYLTLLQPHAQTLNDLPIRMYGVIPINITSKESHLNPVIKSQEEIRPMADYNISVSERDGREMAYTIAVVDEGLLDLTRFKTPDPWSVFNAREALGVRTWDIYNMVLGAYGGKIEQAFSIGGDAEMMSGKKSATINRFTPVVEFHGPFRLKKGDTKKHNFSMPNYNGRVRMMVVAADGKAYGNAEKSVLVRKPVMLLGTLPRVIGVNEEMVIPATVFATKEGVGRVTVSIKCSDNMEIVGSSEKTLTFDKASDKQADFTIRVKNVPGTGRVTITAEGGGDKAIYETDITIRDVSRPISQSTTIVLEGGKSWSENINLPGREGSNSLDLEISTIPPINLTYRLSYLLGYPHGCIEQITSKAFPQLYLKDIASLTKKQETSADQAVKETIKRLRSYLTPEEGFSYWPGNRYVNDWATVYAAHFMTEAEYKGYVIPENIKNSVTSYLRKSARNWRNSRQDYYYSDQITQAYRLFVLALMKSPEIGAMNRLKESVQSGSQSLWLLAAAYSLVGRNDIAEELITQSKTIRSQSYDEYDITFGSDLRDKAVKLMTLNMLGNAEESALWLKEIAEELSSDKWLSTQSTAFALMAATKYIEKNSLSQDAKFSYKIANKQDKINTSKGIWNTNIFENGSSDAKVEINNTGNSTIFARIITTGTPELGEEKAYSKGVALDIKYLDMSGNPIDILQMGPGTDFKTKITVRNTSSRALRNLTVTQIIPAGWEIMNTRYMFSETTPNQPGVNYQDIRDDRIYSYIDYLPANRNIEIEINLSVTYRGTFYLPPVYCEAMYDDQIRANTEAVLKLTVEN